MNQQIKESLDEIHRLALSAEEYLKDGVVRAGAKMNLTKISELASQGSSLLSTDTSTSRSNEDSGSTPPAGMKPESFGKLLLTIERLNFFMMAHPEESLNDPMYLLLEIGKHEADAQELHLRVRLETMVSLAERTITPKPSV